MKYKIENNEVNRYLNLPNWYLINGMPHDLTKQPIETVEAEGFFDAVVPVITAHQELIKLLPSDLVGNKFIQRVYDFTAQDITIRISAAKFKHRDTLKEYRSKAASIITTYREFNTSVSTPLLTARTAFIDKYNITKSEILALTELADINNYLVDLDGEIEALKDLI